MNARTPFTLGIVAVLLSSPAPGQIVLHTYLEAEPSAQAGHSVAIWDDINSDGFREWAIGVLGRNGVGIDSGQVLVFSGFDHSLLTTIDGTVTSGGELRKAGSVCVVNRSDSLTRSALDARGMPIWSRWRRTKRLKWRFGRYSHLPFNSRTGALRRSWSCTDRNGLMGLSLQLLHPGVSDAEIQHRAG